MSRLAPAVRSAMVALAFVSVAGGATVVAAPTNTQRPHPAERETPGPIRYQLELEVLDPAGQHVLLDVGTFDKLAQAVMEVERITRDGVCVDSPDPDDGLAAICYPPARHLRTRVLRVWL